MHVVFESELAPQLLRAALASIALAGVRLHDSLLTVLMGRPSGVLPALAGSAPTLTALHGLPLAELSAAGSECGCDAWCSLVLLYPYALDVLDGAPCLGRACVVIRKTCLRHRHVRSLPSVIISIPWQQKHFAKEYVSP